MHPFEKLNEYSERNGIGFKVTKNAKGWGVILFFGLFRKFVAPTLSEAVDGAIHSKETGSKLPRVGGSGSKGQRGNEMSEPDGASPLLAEGLPDGIPTDTSGAKRANNRHPLR